MTTDLLIFNGVALERPCPDCPTEEQRAANLAEWAAWNDLEDLAWKAYEAKYWALHRGATYSAVHEDWKRSTEWQQLSALRPDEWSPVGCVECDCTGVVLSDAGRVLATFVRRYAR